MKKIMIISIATAFCFSLHAAKTQRIVAVGAAVTEGLFELGMGESIVATDITSAWPKDKTAQLPKLGYFTKLSAEGIMAFKPQSVVAIEGSGPAAVLQQIMSAGISVKLWNSPQTVADAVAAWKTFGKLVGQRQKADALASKLGTEIKSIKQAVGKRKQKLRALFVYARSRNLALIAGKNTVADEVFRLAGWQNAFGGDGFKPMTSEAVAASQAQIILIPAGSVKSLAQADAVWELPGMKLTPAAAKKRVMEIDDTLLGSIGPRIPSLVRAMWKKADSWSD